MRGILNFYARSNEKNYDANGRHQVFKKFEQN